jgi:hypothetical protein
MKGVAMTTRPSDMAMLTVPELEITELMYVAA